MFFLIVIYIYIFFFNLEIKIKSDRQIHHRRRRQKFTIIVKSYADPFAIEKKNHYILISLRFLFYLKVNMRKSSNILDQFTI